MYYLRVVNEDGTEPDLASETSDIQIGKEFANFLYKHINIMKNKNKQKNKNDNCKCNKKDAEPHFKVGDVVYLKSERYTPDRHLMTIEEVFEKRVKVIFFFDGEIVSETITMKCLEKVGSVSELDSVICPSVFQTEDIDDEFPVTDGDEFPVADEITSPNLNLNLNNDTDKALYRYMKKRWDNKYRQYEQSKQ